MNHSTEIQPKIKLLFRHRSMEIGGVEKVLISMLQHLNREIFDITICVTLHQGEFRNDIPKDVKTHFLAKGKEDFSSNSFIQNIQLAYRSIKIKVLNHFPFLVDKFLLKDTFDIEISSTYNDFSSVLNSTFTQAKKLTWFHSDITYDKLQPLVPFIIENLPKFDYIFYGSQQIEDALKSNYPTIALPKGITIRNPINFNELYTKSEAFVPEIDTEIPTFCSVARLHSRKGFHKLMEAHAKLIQEGFKHKIYVIGDGEEYTNLLKQRTQLQVEHSFVFLGTKKNPFPYIKHCDYYIMPSQSEGWPLVIAETLLLQKPIIATNVGGIPEMISHEKTGFLIDYEVDDMYKAMKKFLTDDAIVERIQHNLRNIENQFDNQLIFDTVEKVLVDLYQQKQNV